MPFFRAPIMGFFTDCVHVHGVFFIACIVHGKCLCIVHESRIVACIVHDVNPLKNLFKGSFSC